MKKTPMWRRYLRFWGNDVEADVAEELRFHVESCIEDLTREGWSPDDARAEAERRFGELEAVRQECIDLGERREKQAGRRLRYDVLAQNVRYGLRLLLQKPGFAATAVLSLAIGIGANTAIFSLVNALLINEPSLEKPERLVNVYYDTPDLDHFPLSQPDYDDVVEGTSDAFESVIASQFLIGQTERDGAVATLLGEAVSGNYFRTLGLEAALGRRLLPEDDLVAGAHPVVVLGHRYWQTGFGADPKAVGQSLRLAGRSFEIVGVAPENYPGNMRGSSAAFFAPRMMADVIQGSTNGLQNRHARLNMVKARLRDGASLAEAQAAVDGVASRLREQDPEGWDPSARLIVVPTADVLFLPSLDRWIRVTAWMLTAVVGAVLLLACINLAGFLLAQAVDRRKEISLRLALGATKRDLVTQLLTESLVLATIGGCAGLIATVVLLRAPIAVPAGLFEVELDLRPDLSVLIFTTVATLLAGITLGLAPALRSSRPELASALRQEGAAGGQRGKIALRGALIASQVAVSTVLVAAAALLLRSFQETIEVDPGFGRDPAAVVTFMVPSSRFETAEARRYLDDLKERFTEIPGLLDVGLTSRLHLTAFMTNTTTFTVDGVEPPQGSGGHAADDATVDDGFFAATGIGIVRGRNFDSATDRPDSPRVAIISAALAKRFFSDRDPVGGFLRDVGGSDDLLIVGVASDAKSRSLAEDHRPFIYLPLSQNHTGFLTAVARTTRDADAVAAEMLAAANVLDPDFWAWRVTTMARHVGTVTLPVRLSAIALSAFAGIAVALAAVGVYGAVGYSVARRTREIGIRRSLGATTGSVVRMLMATGLRPVAIGSAVGLVLALFVGTLLSEVLFGVSAFDSTALLGTAAVLLLSALAATWLPAQRASRVAPTTALRSE